MAYLALLLIIITGGLAAIVVELASIASAIRQMTQVFQNGINLHYPPKVD